MIHLIIQVTDWMGATFPDWANSAIFTACYSSVIVPYLVWMPKSTLSDEPFD